MEVKAMRRMVKRLEYDQNVTVVVTDQDWKLAIEIHESRWNITHESDANHTNKELDCNCQELPKEER
jgi:hypothetical protein